MAFHKEDELQKRSIGGEEVRRVVEVQVGLVQYDTGSTARCFAAEHVLWLHTTPGNLYDEEEQVKGPCIFVEDCGGMNVANSIPGLRRVPAAPMRGTGRRIPPGGALTDSSLFATRF